MDKPQATINKILDTFFHLPTLITLALVSVILIWQLYEIEFSIGNGFIRLNTNQGNVTLYWQTGCCQLDW